MSNEIRHYFDTTLPVVLTVVRVQGSRQTDLIITAQRPTASIHIGLCTPVSSVESAKPHQHGFTLFLHIIPRQVDDSC